MAREQGVMMRVIEALPNATYRAEADDGNTFICYLGGKMKKNKINVVVGDKVEVIIDPYGGKATNRIIYRR